MNRKPNCQCSVCLKPIYRRPSQIIGNVYCSSECNGKSQRLNEQKCLICDKLYIGRKKTCSRACSNKNRKGIKYNSLNSNNKAIKANLLKSSLAEMRGGVCEDCGNKNFSILQVHHICRKKDGGNDDFENLRLLCPNCHMTEHFGYSEFLGG